MSRLFLRHFFVLSLLFGPLTLPAPSPWLPDQYPGVAVFVLPLVQDLDISAATLQPDEPQHCSATDRTIWYGFIPSGPLTVTVDTRGSTNTNISIFRDANVSGTFADLEFMDCTSGEPVTLSLEPGKRYAIQVGAIVGESGLVQFRLSDVLAIFGRVIDAVTGAPLPGHEWPFVWVTMHRVCGEGCLQEIGSVPTDAEGLFWFQDYGMWGIEPGAYVFQVSATSYTTAEFGPFEFIGGSLNVGDLALTPIPKIKSIQGRLFDKVTRKPVSQTFAPVVNLYRCTEVDCSELVNSQTPKSDGRFRFETDLDGNPLPPGIYQIRGLADQYYSTETQTFEVREGESYKVGKLRLRSYPVRFSDVTPCEDLPVSGGMCVYSVRLWNGRASKLSGDAWSMVNMTRSDTVVGYTDFQTRQPKPVTLETGGSRVLRFRLKIPAQDASFQFSFCTRIYIGRGDKPLWNVVGSKDLFCKLLGGETPELVPPSEASVQKGEAEITAGKKDVEPNNSCQQAERLGFVSAPLSIQGNLDSLATPDVDYYRFRGIPGQPMMIEDEGEPTGKGTLADPMLEVLDSHCNLVNSNDNSETLNSRLVVSIPADGVLLLGATTSPESDSEVNRGGTYQITITPLTALTTISGTLVEAGTGSPLPGDATPFAIAYLLKCDDGTCLEIAAEQNAESDGRFHFDSAWNGMPLAAGEYRLFVVAEQYETTETASFFLREGEELDIGNVQMTPWPIQFSEIEGCAIPARGGLCEYSARITNRLPRPFSGKAWSVVYAGFDETAAEVTFFQTGTPLKIRLGPGESRRLRFRLPLGGAPQSPMHLCAQGFVGQNPDTFFTPVGYAYLLCLAKGPDGWELVYPIDAEEAIQHMQMQRLLLQAPVTGKKK